MRILHLSDFHYFDENLISEKVVDAILGAIRKDGFQIDCALFTGDLVYYGNKANDFYAAKKALIDRLVQDLGIPESSIIFCPGNHDIDRTKIYPTAENSFKTMYNSNAAINKLYLEKNPAFQDSLLPSSNYISFRNSFYSSCEGDVLKELYSIHYREFSGVRYAFVCVNSAWLSALDGKGANDRGNLLFPPSALGEAISEIRKKPCRKVLLMHHPIHFLKEYNATEIESLVYDTFDLLFSGHVHKAHSSTGHDGTNGLYSHVANASLSHDESTQGCSIIELKDDAENEVLVRELSYVPDVNECFIGSPVVHTIPSGEDKAKAIKFRNTIARKYSLELDFAQKLLLLNKDGDPSEFLSLFSFPQLRTRSDDSLGGQEVSDVLSEEHIFNDKGNLLFLGRDKCGKTTLLRWIQISFLKSFSRYQIVPLYINCKEIESRIDSDFNIADEIRRYYEINKNTASELLDSGSFVLLLDNYSCNSIASQYFLGFLDAHKNCRYIVCSEYMPSRPSSSYVISSREHNGYYFQDLNRVEIVKYVEKRISSPVEQEVVKDQIVRLCKQMQLPINYWTVSLLLLIHRRSSWNNSHSIFEILDVCVDEIFEKRERALKGADISFEKLKKICAHLAKNLFLGYEKSVYSAKKSEIIAILQSFIDEDERIDVSPLDIFNFFQQSGILKLKNPEKEEYVFRHNGFFEYFLALQMTVDNVFRDYVMTNPNLYLAFKNEWDIYSGLRRNDGDFLSQIKSVTEDKVGGCLSVARHLLDKQLIVKSQSFTNIEGKYREIMANRPLSPGERAAIEDSFDSLLLDGDVKPIENYISEGLTPDIVERYLFILGRVFRNSDEIPSEYKNLKIEVFDRILNYYANYAFFSIDYIAKRAESILKESAFEFDESQEKRILRILTDLSPLIAQISLTDSIGQKSMAPLLKKKLEIVRGDFPNNQFLAFIIVFVLADIDLETNLVLIRELMDRTTIPILKTMLYFKLNYYMAFKAGGSSSLQRSLSLMIKDQVRSLDNAISDNSQQKRLHEFRKRSNARAKKGTL